jgi:hypothetical protein
MFPNTELAKDTARTEAEYRAQAASRYYTKTVLGGRVARRGGHHSSWSDWKHNPKYHVREKACARADEEQQPNYPDDRRIHVEIVGKSRADAGDLLIGARTHQPLWSARDRRESWRAGFGLLCTAVVTKLGTDGDVLAAAWASHWHTSQMAMFRLPYNRIRLKSSKSFLGSTQAWRLAD